MPRLTDDAIKQGLLHPDGDVRLEALRYYADAHSRDTTVMPLAIEALKRYGRSEAFRYIHPLTKLAQSEPTIAWAIEELKTRPRWSERDRDYLNKLAQLVSRAEPTLVRPFHDVLASLPAFDQVYRARVDRRIRLLDQDVEGLWNSLEAVCEDGKNEIYIRDIRWDEGVDLVEELGRRGSQAVERMMKLIAVKIEDYENNPQKWMEPLAIRLAGELRHEPAVLLIVDKLREDGDLLNEECQHAFIKIGTDRVIQAIREVYSKEEWGFRLFASGIFEHVHSDLAVQAGLELLEREEDLELRSWLAHALVGQFSTEGNEAARQVLIDDPDLRELRDSLLAACTLTGQDFPELERWRQECEEDRRRIPARAGKLRAAFSSPPPPPILPLPAARRASERIGRNDPCSCGSGKKFKKCCMTKGATR